MSEANFGWRPASISSTELAALEAALEWCLAHGVKAVDFGVTGYWDHSGYDGAEIMPPAYLHVVLDRARANVLAKAREVRP